MTYKPTLWFAAFWMNLHAITNTKVEASNLPSPHLKYTMAPNFFIAVHKSSVSLNPCDLISPIKPVILKKQIKVEIAGAHGSVFKDDWYLRWPQILDKISRRSKMPTPISSDLSSIQREFISLNSSCLKTEFRMSQQQIESFHSKLLSAQVSFKSALVIFFSLWISKDVGVLELKKDKLKSLTRKIIYQGETLDQHWLEHVCEVGRQQSDGRILARVIQVHEVTALPS